MGVSGASDAGKGGGSSAAASSGRSSSSPASSSSSTKSQSETKTATADTPAAVAPKETSVLSEDAQTQEDGLSPAHLDSLSASFGWSGDLADSLPTMPEGKSAGLSGHVGTGFSVGALQGNGQFAGSVSSGTAGALVTPTGTFADTEKRIEGGVQTGAGLAAKDLALASSTESGIGTSVSSTVTREQLAAGLDPASVGGWTAGSELSVTQDNFTRQQDGLSLGPVQVGSNREHREGETQGLTTDGKTVTGFQGDITTDLASDSAGISLQKGGTAQFGNNSLSGSLGLGLSLGNQTKMEQVDGTFSQVDPATGQILTGTFDRTTLESSAGATASLTGQAGMDLNGKPFSVGGTLEGSWSLGRVFQREQVLDYDNSQQRVETQIYGETRQQREAEFTAATDANGQTTTSQTVTMATHPSYQELWKDQFGNGTQFSGDNVTLQLTDEKARELAAQAQRMQTLAPSPLADVLANVTNARELADALTAGQDYSNNAIIERLNAWDLVDQDQGL